MQYLKQLISIIIIAAASKFAFAQEKEFKKMNNQIIDSNQNS